jgi:hypothetical protein
MTISVIDPTIDVVVTVETVDVVTVEIMMRLLFFQDYCRKNRDTISHQLCIFPWQINVGSSFTLYIIKI